MGTQNGKNNTKDLDVDFDSITKMYLDNDIRGITFYAFKYYHDNFNGKRIKKCDAPPSRKFLRVWDSEGHLHETKIPNSNTSRAATEFFAISLANIGGLDDSHIRFNKHKQVHTRGDYKSKVGEMKAALDEIQLLEDAMGRDHVLNIACELYDCLSTLPIDSTPAKKAMADTLKSKIEMDMAEKISEKGETGAILEASSKKEEPTTHWQQLDKTEKNRYIGKIIEESASLATKGYTEEEIYATIKELFGEEIKISPQTIEKLLKEYAVTTEDVYTIIRHETNTLEPAGTDGVAVIEKSEKLIALAETPIDGNWTKLKDGEEVLGDYVIEETMKAYSVDENTTTVVKEMTIKYKDEPE